MAIDYQRHACDTFADLRTIQGVPGRISRMRVSGHSSPYGGGGGPFKWNPESTEPDNNGTILQVSIDGELIHQGRWEREYNGTVNLKMFGAVTETNCNDVFNNIFNSFTGGVDILVEHIVCLVNDLTIPSGFRIFSNQKPASNTYASINHTIRPNSGAEYMFVLPNTTRYAVLENLNIDGNYYKDNTGVKHNANLKAAVSLSGQYNKMLGLNINACAQSCMILPIATCTVRECFMGGWFGDAPIFSDSISPITGTFIPAINDFRATFQIGICGDSYIQDNEFSASLPYFQEYEDPTDVLRDKINGRICAMAAREYFGNSVCTGNIFENADRCVMLAGCVYSYFGENRYELSGMGNLYIRGLMYNTSFVSERFADGSIAGDGVYDDITIDPGAAGKVSFSNPTFITLDGGDVVPAASNKVRYNLTNKGSLEISWVEPNYNDDYIDLGYINPNLPAFPVRQVIGQYYPDSPVYRDSVTVGYKALNGTYDATSSVLISKGQTAADGGRLGSISFLKADQNRVALIGFDAPNDNTLSFALNEEGYFLFSNARASFAKSGDSEIDIRSNDGGTTTLKLISDISETFTTLISMNGETGETNFFSPNGVSFLSVGGGAYTFLNGGITIAKNGGANFSIISNSTGMSTMSMVSDSNATYSVQLSLNNATGEVKITSTGDFKIGVANNWIFAANGKNYIPNTPAAGTPNTAKILSRLDSDGSIVYIPINYIAQPAKIEDGITIDSGIITNSYLNTNYPVGSFPVNSSIIFPFLSDAPSNVAISTRYSNTNWFTSLTAYKNS